MSTIRGPLADDVQATGGSGGSRSVRTTAAVQREPGTAARPPSVSALLRLRWGWLAGGLAAGALAGVAVSGATTEVGHRAESVLQVGTSSADGNRVAQLAQSAQLLGRSGAVLQAAADRSGSEVADLRRRTRVTWEEGTDLVGVSVVAGDPDTAVEEANAVAGAMLRVTLERAQERLGQLRREGDRVLQQDTLDDAEAEASRRGALGAAVAARQDDVIGSATVLRMLDPAAEAVAEGLPPAVTTALGATGGLGVAAAATVAAGGRRRRVRSRRELGWLAPELVTPGPFPVQEQTGRLLDSGAAALVVLAMPGAQQAAEEVAERAVAVVEAHGLDSQVVDALDGLTTELLVTLRDGPTAAGPDLHDPVRVVLCLADEDTLELLAGQPRLLTVLVTTVGLSRLQELRHAASALAATRPTVVVLP